jgi:hypothetical protein
MAKPLGPKSLLIRSAISAHPDTGNTALAEMINSSPARKEDKIKVSANDIAQQRQAMKKAGAGAPTASAPSKKRGRPEGASPRPRASAPVPALATATQTSPLELLDSVFRLAKECGGVSELKRLVDRIAEAQGR